ncbi:MAG: polyamine ABC transporter substrate-binding protein [Lysobacterales bacterium]
MKSRILIVAMASILSVSCGKQEPAPAATETAAAPAPAAEEKVLNVYNWSDYIAEDTLDNFTKETGIKVTYDVFDSNEVLEAKLVSGSTGYDIVVPSLTFLARQIKAGVFQPLDKSKLSNWGNLDPKIMAEIARNDPGNEHAVNWLWGTTGIGYNVDKIKQRLGDKAPTDSWALFFDPANLAKLKDCGVYLLDTPSEILPIALKYLGEEPNSFDPAVIQKGFDQLMKLRPYITQFHSSEYINALANGDACIVIGWSGDIFQAKTRAEEADKGVHVEYYIPKEGAPMWFDMMAIPKDAKHPDNAHQFINYVMRPDVMAGISNYVTYANANQASFELVDEETRNNPGIYPSAEVAATLFSLAVLPPEVDRLFNRGWTTLKTGK